MHTVHSMKLSLTQATDMLEACYTAAQHFDLCAERYAYGEPLRRYYEERAMAARRCSKLLGAWLARMPRAPLPLLPSPLEEEGIRLL